MEKRFLTFIALVVCLTGFSQLPVVPVALSTGPGTWYPSNAANNLIIWLDLYPTNGARSIGSSAPSGDNTGVTNWLNIASSSPILNGFKKNGTESPTNFTSGGGLSGTMPWIKFTLTASTERLEGIDYAQTTNFTLLAVVKCNAVTDVKTEYLLFSGGAFPYIAYQTTGKIEMNAGTSLLGPSSVGTGWNIIVANFNGASSTMTTNGVAYMSGNAGTSETTANYLIGAQQSANPFANFSGGMARLWLWGGTLSSTDLNNALHQTELDFGFPIVP